MAIDDQLAVLLAQNADLFATYEEFSNGQTMLLAGTVDDPNSFNEAGGKTGSLGYYPVVNVSGQTVYVACVERLKAIALGGANAAVLEGLVSQVGGKLTAVDTAVTQATAAGAAATAAGAEATAGAQNANNKAAAAQTVVDAGSAILATVPVVQTARDVALTAASGTAALAGTFNRALVLDIDPTITAPPTMGWVTTAGRWRREPNGWFVCVANGERPYYDPTGRLLGVLIEGAGTVYSAPWHDTAAAHAATDVAYLSKSVAGDAILYAGAHAQPDIHGGTGRGVEITQGATANGIFNAVNVAVNVVANDVVRVDALVSFPATTGVAGTFMMRNYPKSGTQNTTFVTFTVDASGAITGFSTVPNATTYRAGFAQVDVKSDGNPVYYVWFQYLSNGTAVVAPGVNLPTAIAGRKVMLHDLRIQVNPTAGPKATPVLAAAKTFAADTIVTGITAQVGAIFHRIGRCRSKITDGKLSLLPDAAVSGPYVPYERRLGIVPSTEDVDIAGILPNERSDEDFLLWQGKSPPPLGPGYYNQRVTTKNGQSVIDLTLTPAFKKNPMLLPQIERINTSRTYLTGALTCDDIVIFSRASEITHQQEQVDLPANQSAMNNLDVGTNIFARRCVVTSHLPSCSRARAEVQADDDPTNGNSVWMGVHYLNSAGGGTFDVSGSHFMRIGRACAYNTNAMATAVTLLADDCWFDQIWSDSFYSGTGTFTVSFNRNMFARPTAALSDLYQSRKEIEVNIGNGWQSFSSSGLAISALPIGRRASFYGTWDFTAGTLTEAPVADRTIVVRSFLRFSSTRTNKPGYQWNASQATYPGEMRFPAVGDVYVITQSSAPSPTTPWIRLTCDLGYWNGATYVADANAATLQTGTHPDTHQINRTGGIITSITANDCVLTGDQQGPFLTGDPTLSAAGSDIRSATLQRWIVVTPTSLALAFDWCKTAGSLCTMADWLALPMVQSYRFNNGTRPEVTITTNGPNNTVALSNVWVGHRTGVSPLSVASGASVTGVVNQVKIAEVTNYVVTPPAGLPTITQMIAKEFIDPAAYSAANLDPMSSSFAFTPYAEVKTGIPLNAIIRRARGTHARWKPLKTFLAKLQRDPDFVVVVPAATAIGTALLLKRFQRGVPEANWQDGTLRSSTWMPLFSGNEKRFFEIASGTLVVAKALTGLNQCWLLWTAAEELILVDIQ